MKIPHIILPLNNIKNMCAIHLHTIDVRMNIHCNIYDLKHKIIMKNQLISRIVISLLSIKNMEVHHIESNYFFIMNFCFSLHSPCNFLSLPSSPYYNILCFFLDLLFGLFLGLVHLFKWSYWCGLWKTKLGFPFLLCDTTNSSITISSSPSTLPSPLSPSLLSLSKITSSHNSL